MYIRTLIFFLLFIFIGDRLFAATFTVTSNADSGPGTLRQALIDAATNGTVATDNINFNLPGNTQAAITITLLSQLPDVTANVTIDGTTQPGLALGVSNAKVIITPVAPAANFNAFNVSSLVGVNDAVEIYGLYIEGFSPNQRGLGNAIIASANCKLVVGAAGKGNVISGNAFAFTGFFQNATIQGNFIGIKPDGVTPFINSSVFYSAQDYNNLLIGGATAQDGNVILSGNTGGINFGGGNPAATKIATIENNYFNTDYTGTKSIAVANNSCILVNDTKTLLFVTANVFSAAEVGVKGVNQSAFIIKGNFFGTDKTQTLPLGSGTWAIENDDVNSSLGGTTAAEQNVFTNYQNPINAYNNSFTNVIQNIFYCNGTVQLNDPTGGKNFIRLTTLTNNTVGGDAPPGATVQLYYTQTKCGSCNPNTWFATVTANAAGKWQYNGVVAFPNVLASSTVAGNTMGFQFDLLTQNEVTITNFDCHHGGTIALNEKRTGNFQFTWTDSKNVVVSNGQSATNLQPGTYTLLLNETGGCPSVSASFTVIDLTPKVFAQTVQLDCSNPTGSFTTFPSTGPGITVASYYWEDPKGNLISNKQTVHNLAAGNYTLYIKDNNGCFSPKVICKVLPATATPVINDGTGTVTDATCGLPNGSVTGITITNGAGANYGWSRANGTLFSFGNLNLTNAPAGQYYLFVNYNFNCPPVKSKMFTINPSGVITLNESAVSTTSSTCSNSNGSIKGIVETGATTFQWYDSNNSLAGSAIDLVNVPSGTYHLVVSNAICSQQSKSYVIQNIPAFDNYPSTFVTTDAVCTQNNGSISVTFDPTNAPASYRWVDANGTTLMKDVPLQKVAAGTYTLYVTDGKGCESLFKTYTITTIPPVQITAGSGQITKDQCGHGLGSVENIAVTAGMPPYTYTWLNSSQQIVGTSINITGLYPGVYTLQIKDATPCGLATHDYAIADESMVVAAPLADNVQICSPGEALFSVNNPQPGYGYRLYDSQSSPQPLAHDTTGIFKVSVSNTRNFYITQYTGSCESARVEVKVTIGLSDLTIPNTFTPNNDGVNDYWMIKGIETYPNVLVQIFSRYGQRVFESKGYSNPFDGKYGASALPPGVYYYIINLNSNCTLLSGNLTLIR